MRMKYNFGDTLEVGEIDTTQRSAELPETIPIYSGSYEGFCKDYMWENIPCLIPVDDSLIHCRTDAWIKEGTINFKSLRRDYGKKLVPIAHCGRVLYNQHAKANVPMSKFLRYWQGYRERNYPWNEERYYMQDWHFVRENPDVHIYDVPPQFSCDWLNEYYLKYPTYTDDFRFVFMGPKSTWSPLRVDIYNSCSWSLNVFGEKEWYLFPPGEEEKLKDGAGNTIMDVRTPSAQVLLKRANVKYYQFTQGLDEALFVPSGWHYQVVNTVDTMSIYHNFINGCNIDLMWKAIKSNLEAVKNELQDVEDTASNWEKECQKVLRSSFGLDYEEFYDFLRTMKEVRMTYLKNRKDLVVFDNWKLGKNHISFDLDRINDMFKVMHADEDMQTLVGFGLLTFTDKEK